MDLERLDGVGCIEFDEDAATLEDAIMRDTVEAYNRRIKDFEEHQKARYVLHTYSDFFKLRKKNVIYKNISSFFF